MQEEEESLAHFEMTEQAFEATASATTSSSSSSSVQTPVISQVSSTMNYDPQPPAPPPHNPGSRAPHGGEVGAEGTPADQSKNAAVVTSLPESEEGEGEKEEEGRKQKKALVSITIEWGDGPFIFFLF